MGNIIIEDKAAKERVAKIKWLGKGRVKKKKMEKEIAKRIPGE